MKTSTIGNLIKRKREMLALSQRALALRVGSSGAYIAYLETGARHPSFRMLARLATALELDEQRLGSIAYPQLRKLFGDTENPTTRFHAWRMFMKIHRKRHNVSGAEQRVLYEINKLGRIRRPRDFVHIITVIRASLDE